MIKPTGVECKVCQGEIMADEKEVFNSMFGPPIDGPGHEKQWSIKTEYYCGQCGIVYRFLPTKKGGK
jgi:hypothetical protein